MCGISGIIAKDTSSVTTMRLQGMTDCIAHRGPDGDGHWINNEGNVGLGHRRLSIIDLSHGADQPMHYQDRYTIVFNGEIYNYVELKDVLLKQGYHFKTESDTEVLMALYDRDKENCLQLLDGMFAFVIYDAQEKNVFAARDRFGEKPFFYSYEPGKYFVFGSEMKSIKAFTGDETINNRMMYNYLSFGSLDNKSDPAETFFANIKRLPHAHYAKIDLQKLEISINRYWDISVKETNRNISLEQAKEQLHELFYTSVNRRLRSDVNVGSSLSGGLDSSLIVCVIDDLLKKNKAEHSFETSSFKQKTFSARFPGFKKDEGKFMQMVIDSTRVEPHFVFPDDKQLVDDIDHLMKFQEEPFGGASILVQYEVMKLARQNDVTVLLDGQGADEILAGYHGYYNAFFRTMEKQDKQKYTAEYEAYREIHKNNEINALQEKNLEYRIRQWFPGQINNIKRLKAFVDQRRNKSLNRDFYAANSGNLFDADTTFNDLNQALYRSTMGGDLQVLLRYADRNSMANSREVRLPFLSHELVEFLFTLPADMKMHKGWTKYIMRETFQEVLPKEISWRVDKIGYEPPQKKWMDSPAMKDSIMASREKLVQQGFLDKRTLDKAPGAYGANEKGDNSWGHLMAGKLIK
ncbi:MAG: hypothetical protein JWQ27_2522 [Ferruginibacter sp.]|nr:hypothetical protein [Ferruginibacter sp.]